MARPVSVFQVSALGEWHITIRRFACGVSFPYKGSDGEICSDWAQLDSHLN